MQRDRQQFSMDTSDKAELIFKAFKYVFLFAIGLLLFGLIYFYFNPDELKCPDEYLVEDVYPIQFEGIVEGVSLTCEKNMLTVFCRFNNEKIALQLTLEYACLFNEIKLGDSIYKESNSYEFKLSRGKQEYTYSYNCHYDCPCNSGWVFSDKKSIYRDVVTGIKTDAGENSFFLNP